MIAAFAKERNFHARSCLTQSDINLEAEPTVVPRAEHGISRADISESALKVLYRLKKAGFAAYIVGGGVRDLLLGLHPKDYDVVTDASPDEVRSLFRNSRLIGRRFRLAHVRFGREIIEVATFRAGANEDDSDADREHDLASGRILRDNVYGSIGEDIWRRDFTANALYYNIADFSVWDYTGGLDDIAARTLRLIGDPETRYREDPVRMLRAVRFASKLDFSIHDSAAEPLPRLAPLLRDVPAARLFDEVLKLFQSGHAVRSFEILDKYGLFEYLFPVTAQRLRERDASDVREFILRGLADTDARVADDKPITPMFLYAVLLWPAIRTLASELEQREELPSVGALTQACYETMAQQQACTALPKRFSVPMREILALQPRFEHRKGARAGRFLGHKRFRAAYDFMLLRASSGELDEEVAQWWSAIQQRPESELKQALGSSRPKSGRRRGGRRRRGRARSGSSPS
jgi:poly(A) polymerase